MLKHLRKRSSDALLRGALDNSADRHELQDRLEASYPVIDRYWADQALAMATGFERMQLWLALKLQPQPMADRAA